MKKTNSESNSTALGSNQYLQLPVRLFIATSGDLDPLVKSTSAEEGDPDIEPARFAVNYSSWISVGINSSADYLRLLFEDLDDQSKGNSTAAPSLNGNASDGSSGQDHPPIKRQRSGTRKSSWIRKAIGKKNKESLTDDFVACRDTMQSVSPPALPASPASLVPLPETSR